MGSAGKRRMPWFENVWTAASPRSAGEQRWLLLLFVIAFLVRLIFLAAYGLNAPLVDWGDDHVYDDIARALVFEGSYVNTWFPPGYPLFLSMIYLVLGPNLVAVRLIQATLGAASCCVTYLLGRNVAGLNVGLIAGLLLAFYPGHVFMTWRLMGEGPFIFFMSLAVLFATQLEREPRKLKAAGVGLNLGAASLIKSNLILFPPMLIGWLAWLLPRRSPRRFPALVALAGTFGLLYLAVPLFNWIATGEKFVFVAGNSGHTLWYANNPQANGYFNDNVHPEGLTPELVADMKAHSRGGIIKEMNPFQIDRIYRDAALNWIWENPGAFLNLCAKKLSNAYGPLPQAAVFKRNPVARPVHLVAYGFLLPFIIIGLIVSLRQWRSYSLLYLILISYSLMVLLYYGTPRFTVLVIPYLLIFASLGGTALIRFWKNRSTA